MKPISVLLPVHGKGKYFSETLESIGAQDWSLFLLIVVNDGCQFDLLSEISKVLPREMYSVVKTQKRGIANALNEGLQVIDSEFIARIDSDDIMLNHRLERQLEEFYKNPNLILCGSSILLVDEFGQEMHCDNYPEKHYTILREFSRRNPFAHPSVLYRTSTVKKVGGYREFFEGAEDFDLWLRMIGEGEFKNIPTPLTKYRVHREQVTQSKSEEVNLALSGSLVSHRLRMLGLPDLPERYPSLHEWKRHSKPLNLANARSTSMSLVERLNAAAQLSRQKRDWLRYTIYMLIYGFRRPLYMMRKLISKVNQKMINLYSLSAHFTNQKKSFIAEARNSSSNLVTKCAWTILFIPTHPRRAARKVAMLLCSRF